MACPKCGCKVTYQYDDDWEFCSVEPEDERCANCGHIFWIEDSLPEEDEYDDPLPTNEIQ